MHLPAYLPQWLKSAAAAIFHVETRPLALRDTLPDQAPPPALRDTLPDQSAPPPLEAVRPPELAASLRGQGTQRAHGELDQFRE